VAVLREVSELLYPAVCETIAALDLDSKDAAAVKLAKQYARTIDEQPPGKAYAGTIRWLGPELHKILESLGATPAARAAMKTGQASGNANVSKLDELRAARRA
jgi:hypothetical protein